MLIQYYQKDVYGTRLEYVADTQKAKTIQALTGKRTIDFHSRQLITDLTDGQIQFELIHKP